MRTLGHSPAMRPLAFAAVLVFGFKEGTMARPVAANSIGNAIVEYLLARAPSTPSVIALDIGSFSRNAGSTQFAIDTAELRLHYRLPVMDMTLGQATACGQTESPCVVRRGGLFVRLDHGRISDSAATARVTAVVSNGPETACYVDADVSLERQAGQWQVASFFRRRVC